MKSTQWDQLLAGVTKPARYTDAEWNAVHAPDKQPAVRIALGYPDVYEVGMSHLGLRLLYHALNDDPRFAAERFFSPWPDMQQVLRAHGLPLCTLESNTPLRDFDAVGIDLPYELTFTNVLDLLDLGGVPVQADQRGDEHPIVIAGGPATANPEPMADFVDAFFIGEADLAILQIAEALAEAKGREARLAALAQVPGVYVPAWYRLEEREGMLCPVPREGAPATIARVLVDLETAPYPTRQVVPYLETIHDRVTLEVMRGCSRGCRFCQAGMVYRPVRERTVETLKAQARAALDCTGYDEVSLLGFNSADYSRVEALIDGLLAQHAGEMVSISMPSMRVDTFSVELARRLQTVRKGGLTFAPEAGSQRLRDVVNKNVTEADLFAAAEAAFASGWFHLKLYFMIGLPTETDEDVAAIVDLVRRLQRLGRERLGANRGRLRLAVSVNAFVPKAHTPFQWFGQEPADSLRRKQGLLQQGLAGKGLDLTWTRVEASLLEAVLARGDRSLGRVIAAAWRSGCRFDAWNDEFKFETWQRAFAEHGMDPQALAARSLPPAAALPWDHISYGVTKQFLQAQAEAALRGECTPDCRFAGCTLCGACPAAAGAG